MQQAEHPGGLQDLLLHQPEGQGVPAVYRAPAHSVPERHEGVSHVPLEGPRRDDVVGRPTTTTTTTDDESREVYRGRQPTRPMYIDCVYIYIYIHACATSTRCVY